MHGQTAPTPAAPQGLSIYITPSGTYSLQIGVYSITDVASDNSDLITKVKAALPEGWDLGYNDVNSTTAELTIWPPQGLGGVTAEVTGDATAEIQSYLPAYGDACPEGALYVATDINDTFLFIPYVVDDNGPVVRNRWQNISNG